MKQSKKQNAKTFYQLIKILNDGPEAVSDITKLLEYVSRKSSTLKNTSAAEMMKDTGIKRISMVNMIRNAVRLKIPKIYDPLTLFLTTRLSYKHEEKSGYLALDDKNKAEPKVNFKLWFESNYDYSQLLEKRSLNDDNIKFEDFVCCEKCGARVNKKNIKKHMKNKHEEMTLEQRKQLLSKMSSSERKRYINEILGPERVDSDDLFDRGKVVSGGGFGVGRKRNR